MQKRTLEITLDEYGLIKKCVFDGFDLPATSVTIDGGASQITTATITLFINNIVVHKPAHLVE